MVGDLVTNVVEPLNVVGGPSIDPSMLASISPSSREVCACAGNNTALTTGLVHVLLVSAAPETKPPPAASLRALRRFVSVDSFCVSTSFSLVIAYPYH